MKVLRKGLYLVLCLTISAYTFPVYAVNIHTAEEELKTELTDQQMQQAVGAGNVDATMSEYVKFDPNQKPIAEAVVSNRSLLTVPYILEVMDMNSGASLEELASGTLAPGETKVISGSATVANHNSVRVKVGSGNGLVAIDTAMLVTKR